MLTKCVCDHKWTERPILLLPWLTQDTDSENPIPYPANVILMESLFGSTLTPIYVFIASAVSWDEAGDVCLTFVSLILHDIVQQHGPGYSL